MFGATMETALNAVNEGRNLRIIARAIWRAGVWRCDRPVNAHAMFEDLGRALGLKSDAALRTNPNQDDMSGTIAEEVPYTFEPIEKGRASF